MHRPLHRLPRRSLLVLAAVTTAAALALSGCSGSADGGGAASAGTSGSESASSSSPSPSSTVSVPSDVDLTAEGSKLSFKQPANVIFEPTQNRGSVLRLNVASVRKGSLDDFKGFILDDRYKRNADYFYATVTVRNVGQGDVGGVAVPLWGVSSANTLLPAVNFTTTFAKCPSKKLPATFGPGDTLSTCLVYLSPNQGSLDAISYRPSQEFNPITWTGDLTPTKKADDKGGRKKSQGQG
ncbi:MAG: hypothetical protein HOQ22_02215 [Nocardioidaceae bacterium]|nr:hypothetical protein [Nocardioidaceae bacterium]NUS49839.1 hypothetical protein [Nocardioidaceae bacterium]